MNRLKLWVFALVVSGAALFAVREVSLGARRAALEAVDARVSAAAARVRAAERSLADSTSAIAVLASRDPLLAATLDGKEAAPAVPARRTRGAPPPPVDPAAEEAKWQEAARAAVAAAEKAAGFTIPENARIAAGNREWLARRSGASTPADAPLVELLATAIGGTARRGPAAWSGQLWMTAAAPAGNGGGIVILVPLDAAWIAVTAAGSGVDLTLVGPDVKPISTARGAGAAELAAGVVRAAPAIADAGALAKVDLGLDAVKLPKAGLLFAAAPAARAQALPVGPVKGAHAIVSASTERLLAPVVRFQWWALVGVAGVLVLGLVFGFLVGPTEVAAKIPEELLAAAARVGRGDLTARAPALAGQLGTVADALNRALDASARPPAPEAPSVSQEFFTKAAPPAPLEPSAFEFPLRAPPAPLEPASAGLGGGAFEAAPVPAPRAPAAPAPAPVAFAPDLLHAAARAAPPPGDVAAEDGHWREIFQDFLRVRGDCGESAEGLTFERFRQKLESNKANLVAKYGCRTVRFQVYVKEGKAALKATPVK